MSGIRYFRTDPKNRTYSAQFAAVSDKLESPEHFPPGHPYAVMNIGITPRSFIPNFGESEGNPDSYSETAKELGVHPEYLRHLHDSGTGNWDDVLGQSITRAVFPDDEDDRKAQIKWLKKQPELKPQTLFTETEPSVHVRTLFSHSTMTTPAMTLGALAMNATGASHLTADEDLSPHSSRLAEHAQRLGVVQASTENPDMDVTNDYDFEDDMYIVSPSDLPNANEPHAYISNQRMIEIPQHEVAQARQTMRQILRGNRPDPKKNLSPQFDHPKLPGLEDF